MSSKLPIAKRARPVVLVLAAGVTSLFIACSGGEPAPLDGVGSGWHGASCATPQEGCACDTPGATAECGQVVSSTADVVTCTMGTRTCNAGTWGTCVGDHTAFRSTQPIGDYRPLGMGTPGTCVDDPCDPNCQIIGDTPTGLDGGPGIAIVDGGLTLANSDGGGCSGLQCQVAKCDGGVTTTLTGTVYDPAGLNPIYHAYVYVPAMTPLPPIPAGAQMDACGGGGNLPPSVTYFLTGPDGKFTLTGVPTGANIPLVVQAGKWRRMVTVNVSSCTTTALPASQTRLPKNQSEGNLPNIAIVTGSCDPMECLINRMGVDASEFRDPGTGGHVDYYAAGGYLLKGGKNPGPQNLLNSAKTMSNYDLVMLPCDCGNEYGTGSFWTKPTKSGGYGMTASWLTNLVTYTSAGGRLFSSHWGREWIEGGGFTAPFPGVANWIGDIQGGGATGFVNQTFTKGVDFANWLKITGASTTLGQIAINPLREDTSSVIAPTQLWVAYGKSTGDPADFTFDTPVGAKPASQYGRVMYTDMHLASGGLSLTFPSECPTGALTAQEKAAEFLLFDLGACLSPLPPPPATYYTTATYSRSFTASCPTGKVVDWRTFYWEDITPGNSNIVFTAQTGDTLATLGSAVSLATVSGAPNLTWVGADVHAFLTAAGQKSKAVLQVNMTLNPTSDHLQAPTLLGWEQTFDCVDAL